MDKAELPITMKGSGGAVRSPTTEIEHLATTTDRRRATAPFASGSRQSNPGNFPVFPAEGFRYVLWFANSLGVASLLALCMVCAGVTAGERAAPATPESVDMFSAIDQGQIEVKLIPKDSTLCNVLVENKTDKPLTVKLPEAFAGVPVLAQLGGMGGGLDGGGGSSGYGGGSGGGSQGFGGGMGGMGGMGGGMMGGGFMNVAPEKVSKFKVTTVCLEHGKSEPRAAIPYKIVPIEQFTQKKEVHELCKMLGYGKMPQRVAQVAAWALNNDMSWQALAAKRIEHANGTWQPYFHPMEIRAAMQVARRHRQNAPRAAREEIRRVELPQPELTRPAPEHDPETAALCAAVFFARPIQASACRCSSGPSGPKHSRSRTISNKATADADVTNCGGREQRGAVRLPKHERPAGREFVEVRHQGDGEFAFLLC